MGETESIYQSQGPAKKATLLKRLTLSRVKEGDDIRQHLDQFFDAVDKLREMKLEVNDDLLAIMLLYSLPPSFKAFDVLLNPMMICPSRML